MAQASTTRDPLNATGDAAGPLISVTTPTFNQGGTIRQTIESVLGQGYGHFDYWVIDAGSTDGTVDILREYERDPRFHWLSEPDRGQADAINKGLARATGAYFNWINSDDYLAPGALAAVAEEARRNPRAELISGATDEFQHESPQVFHRTRLQVRSCPEETVTVGVYCQPSTFWRTDVFRALGGVNPRLHYMMDWDLWVRYLALHGQGRVVKIDPVLAYYRHHAAAKTSKSSSEFYREAQVIFERFHRRLQAPPGFYGEAGPAPDLWDGAEFELGPHFRRSRYLESYCLRMVRVLRHRDRAGARAWLARSLRYFPWITPWKLKMAWRLGLPFSSRAAAVPNPAESR